MRSFLIGLALIGSLLSLAACGEKPQPALRVGVNPWVGYDPLVLARDERLFDTTRVRVVELASSSESMRNLRNGLLDAAALTLDEALRLADEGLDLRIVAVLGESNGADALLADPMLHEPPELAGKRIGVESGAVGALVLGRVLQHAGLEERDITVVALEAARHERALRDGHVDAIVTFEPIRGRLEAAGYRVLFDSRQMPGEIVDVLALRSTVLDARPDDVAETLRAWERGRISLEAAPEATAVMLARGTDLTANQYLDTLEGLTLRGLRDSVALLGGHPPALATGHTRLVAELLRLGLIRREPDWASLLTAEVAARVETEREARR
jgi:NitT/TauT family transport system substrate-binding protein